MLHKELNLLILIALPFLSMACSSSGNDSKGPTDPIETPKIPISLNCGIASRVTDSGFENKDKIGLYVVNYSNGNPSGLQLTGNYVDNAGFTYNGSWTPDKQLYWKDETTKADFYAYYPYGSISSLTAQQISVNENQSIETNYKASEFLWGKVVGVTPTEQAVNLTLNHVFCCAVIKLTAGNGFTAESLASSTITVKLNNFKTNATIDLTNGSVTATGDAKTITPCRTADGYKALIVPQTVTGGNLITINVDGRDYNLTKDFTFTSGKRDTFTIIISKTNTGLNVNIGSWNEDGKDYGGTAE
jgi:hypothetical protein